jgi:hypothetical protein
MGWWGVYYVVIGYAAPESVYRDLGVTCLSSLNLEVREGLRIGASVHYSFPLGIHTAIFTLPRRK